MATTDVMTTVINSNSTHNGYSVVLVSSTGGTIQTLAPKIIQMTSHSGYDSRYKERFDNYHYYT
jgi:hypothetical protein